MGKNQKNIGINITPPSQLCTDKNCPFHGNLRVRGTMIRGKIVSASMEKSVIIQKERKHYIPKYQRYEKRTRRYAAHLPPCIPVNLGDDVTIMECRPLSKTKSFVVVEKK
jgi:small subunit ribosomal protein S17